MLSVCWGGRIGCKTAAILYRIIVESVLLYGCESWVVPEMLWGKLRAFHNTVARSLAGLKGRYIEKLGIYLTIDPDLARAAEGLEDIRFYVERRRSNLLASIQTLENGAVRYDLCRSLGTGTRRVWWDQGIG